ncbi:GerAB/ArcD/ProY family transporter [Clostridium sp. DL1XJH146]
MKNKEYISPLQFYFFITGFILGSAIIMSTALDVAGRDIWISHLIAMMGSILVLLMMFFIVEKNPDKEIHQIFEKLFGKIASRFILIIYFIYVLLLGGLVIDNVSEFMTLMVMQHTDEWIYILTITVITCYILSKGLEVMSRCIEVVSITSFIIYIIVILLLLTDMDFGALLPAFSKGKGAIFKAAFIMSGYPYNEIVTLFFILPNIRIKDQQKALKFGIWGIVTATIILIILDLLMVGIMGDKEAARNLFATFEITKMIHIGESIERLELVVLWIWFFSAYIKISCIFYALVKSIQGIFNLNDYKSVAIPMAILMIPIADNSYEDYEKSIRAVIVNWPVCSGIMVFILSIIFFVIICRNRKKVKS